MENALERTVDLYGDKVLNLKNKHVAVFGLGGVGGYAVEALCRSGIGKITIIDNDVYSVSNLNRQLYATTESVGKKKIEAVKERINIIAPSVEVSMVDGFILQDDGLGIDFSKFDYVIDAIDTVSGKIKVITESKKAGVKVISCMGTGNKTDPTAFKVADISKTKICPLAKVVRKLLKDIGVTDVLAVYSEEEPIKNGKQTPSSNAFVPGVAGLILAGTCINDLIGEKDYD